MSINPQSFLAFTSELSKLAFASHLGGFLREGWRGGGTFGKVMNVGIPAMQLPGALKQEDQTGQGRSRVERVGDIAGQAVGGMAGMGAATKATQALGWQAGQAGSRMARAGRFMGRNVLLGGVLPMAGGYLASKVLTAPSRIMRQRREQQQQPSPNPGDGAAQTPIAQEGQQGQLR
jgi:hypothetical protein